MDDNSSNNTSLIFHIGNFKSRRPRCCNLFRTMKLESLCIHFKFAHFHFVHPRLVLANTAVPSWEIWNLDLIPSYRQIKLKTIAIYIYMYIFMMKSKHIHIYKKIL